MIGRIWHGDYDTSGDETRTFWTFYPRYDMYIVDKPAVIQTTAGVGGALLQETRIHYDNRGYTETPIAGYPTL